jgi:signal transduction histidine kinase
MGSVLVVDDNAQNRALARDTLEAEGYEVLEAGDGATAVERFRSHTPDCVLMDACMPELDGFEASARIRALPEGNDTPIIFLTALRDLETFDAAQRAGASDFLTKPVRPSELVSRVNAALKLRRASVELRGTLELVKKQRDEMLRIQLQKERLSTFVVHDLKSPVATIDLLAQRIQKDALASESSRAAAAHIRADVRRTIRLILNLIDISRAEEGRLAHKPSAIALDELVREVADASAIHASEEEIVIEQDVATPALHADRDLVRRLLENLVENAIRHAPKQSRVRIIAARDESAVLLKVADAGAGVPPALRERIFDRYVRLEKENRDAGEAGRGLGLAFCKMVAEAHGGSLAIEDANPGAIFCARFPDV